MSTLQHPEDFMLSYPVAVHPSLVLHAGSPPASASQQQWQQQQQQALLSQQQQQFSSSSITMTGALPQQRPLSLPSAAEGPSLQHPSTIPLTVEGEVVRDAQGNVLLDKLHPNLALNSTISKYGALVFGASSERGAAHAWDLTVGRVSSCAGGCCVWDGAVEERQCARHVAGRRAVGLSASASAVLLC